MLLWSKRLLPGVLLGVLGLTSLVMAGPPAPPAGADSKPGDVLTEDGLLQMLRGLGYEPRVENPEGGAKSYTVKVTQNGLDFYFTVTLSKDKSVVWIYTWLGHVPAADKVLPEPLLRILQLNGQVGTARFEVTQDGYLILEMPMDNHGITPMRLRGAFEGLMSIFLNHKDELKTGLWSKEGQQAAAFKTKIEALYGRVREAYQEFFAALQPIYDGGTVDRERLKKAHAKLVQAIHEAREGLKGLEVPNTPAAHELYSAYERELDLEEALAGNELAQAVGAIEDGKGNADSAAKAKDLINQWTQKTNVTWNALNAAYASFRKYYGDM